MCTKTVHMYIEYIADIQPGRFYCTVFLFEQELAGLALLNNRADSLWEKLGILENTDLSMPVNTF